MELRGKIAVITGGSHGLGKALAEILRKEEAQVVISSRSMERLSEAAKDTGAIPIVADVRNESDVAHLAEEAEKRFGRIDIWINNAGIWIPRNPVTKTDWKAAHDVFEVNFFGTAYGSREALLRMTKNRSGTIVNIISTSALDDRAGLPAYQSSKWAVRGFTGSLRSEAAEFGVAVIAVYPGGMRTLGTGDAKPPEYSTWLDPLDVARKVVENLKKDAPEKEQEIRRPNA